MRADGRNGFRLRASLRCALSFLVFADPSFAAQQDSLPPGVQLETRYTSADRQTLAVRPFGGADALASVRATVSGIITTDLTQSDRFRMMPTPALLAGDTAVDYAQWNALGVVFVVAGEVIATTGGFDVRVALHDAPLGRIERSAAFALPAAADPDFRLAVHAIADEIVRWITGQPGSAASRIAFVRLVDGAYTLHGESAGFFQLMLADAVTGAGVTQLTADGENEDPSWAPDSRHIVYLSKAAGAEGLYVLDVVTGSTRLLLRGRGFRLPDWSPLLARAGATAR